jgi:hypothetical protein
MSPTVKSLIGLVAVLLMAWIYHGPLGNGAAFIDRIEAEARLVVAEAEVAGTEVRFDREPLSRTAIMSGPANEFQREGEGELKGLNDLVGEIEGVGGVRWTDEGGGGGLPLLIEALIWMIAAYLIGIGLGWLFFGRPKKESYLG